MLPDPIRVVQTPPGSAPRSPISGRRRVRGPVQDVSGRRRGVGRTGVLSAWSRSHLQCVDSFRDCLAQGYTPESGSTMFGHCHVTVVRLSRPIWSLPMPVYPLSHTTAFWPYCLAYEAMCVTKLATWPELLP